MSDEPKKIRVDHPKSKDHPDGIGYGFIVHDGSERSENLLHHPMPVANGACPVCAVQTTREADDEIKRQGGFIHRCKCGTSFFVSA